MKLVWAPSFFLFSLLPVLPPIKDRKWDRLTNNQLLSPSSKGQLSKISNLFCHSNLGCTAFKNYVLLLYFFGPFLDRWLLLFAAAAAAHVKLALLSLFIQHTQHIHILSGLFMVDVRWLISFHTNLVLLISHYKPGPNAIMFTHSIKDRTRNCCSHSFSSLLDILLFYLLPSTLYLLTPTTPSA